MGEKKRKEAQRTNFIFEKANYKWFFIGLAFIAIGFILMSGGGSENPDIFNEEELFSCRRITLAPFLVMLGYGLVLFGIMKKN